ncbi:cell division protein ZapA [Aurantiacibacter poecillastricola]|uniref:cell division protein ZapA n=1 Tax=Aurantiacibacter poecillastricola TaxID=3064385 RepID=UPI00273D7741|nr:cell division protein ZapA [Aurantiacibacter sp. 219JJ12-13]MDP5261869.1 cell division protein ZapA [Aurantiacibacter sp. 219JJ12-13]
MSTSNVTLSIAGRSFTLACAPGEEAHILRLGNTIDAKLREQNNFGSQSAERILLYASLMLADELHELRSAGTQSAAEQDASAEPLENVARRLEELADHLESDAPRA